MNEKGDCLQDVHVALVNALLQRHFPDRAGFQTSNRHFRRPMGAVFHKRKEQSKYTLTKKGLVDIN